MVIQKKKVQTSHGPDRGKRTLLKWGWRMGKEQQKKRNKCVVKSNQFIRIEREAIRQGKAGREVEKAFAKPTYNRGKKVRGRRQAEGRVKKISRKPGRFGKKGCYHIVQAGIRKTHPNRDPIR